MDFRGLVLGIAIILAVGMLAGCSGGGGQPSGGEENKTAVQQTPTPQPQQPETPVAEEPEPEPEEPAAQPATPGLEIGKTGLLAGTAGWANNLGLARAKSWQADAYLTHVGTTTDLATSLDYRCKLRESDVGSGWVLGYASPSTQNFYSIVVDFNGISYASEVASSSHTIAISDWQLDSNELCEKASFAEGKTPAGFELVAGTDGITLAKIPFKEGGLVSVRASDGIAPTA